jgi:beta-lactamase class D
LSASPKGLLFLSAAVMVALSVAGCSPRQAASDQKAKVVALDTAALNGIVDASFGGPNTCLAVIDRKTGRDLYVYGSNATCMRPLPPCSTFKIPNALIGLDMGLITPQTVYKWDGKPQPIKSWETDANLDTAYKRSMVWWFQRLARQVGHDTYTKRLKAMGYGSADPAGPVDGFWLGPEAGGGLTISTRQQTEFLRRFYGAELPVKAASSLALSPIMVDETRGAAVMSGKTGTCSSLADGSRSVGWWVGRLETPDRDLIFAASMEGSNALPGRELQIRIKSAFARVGLWPAA